MKTDILKAIDLNKPEIKEKIKKQILDNQLIVFPTETVYGIGANALSPEAVKKIFLIKGRPSDNPLIVHLNDASQVTKYIKNISIYAKPLMDGFLARTTDIGFRK
ncbi:MAG: Sua5/YciO/YrdC/YwlC family protein [Candidatus Izemoplasmatales bacterium]|nr:Sua5/YciO/YrdC/YwlC family protein [Candidatus Izemoplasmatales bacterium]